MGIMVKGMENMEQTQKNYALKGRLAGRKYMWMLLYIPLCFSAFMLLQLRDVSYTAVYIPIDSSIPFCEHFALFYWAWYFLMAGTGVYMLIKDETGFRNYMLFLMTGFSLCLVTYLLYPTGQHLRPVELPNDGLFCRAMDFIYSIDPSINVLPSMHAVGSFMCAAVLIMSPEVKKRAAKAGLGILSFMCGISTVFVKQHSLLDVIASVGICIPIFLWLYAPWTTAKRRELSPPCQMRWLSFGVLSLAVSCLCLWYVVITLAGIS